MGNKNSKEKGTKSSFVGDHFDGNEQEELKNRFESGDEQVFELPVVVEVIEEVDILNPSGHAADNERANDMENNFFRNISDIDSIRENLSNAQSLHSKREVDISYPYGSDSILHIFCSFNGKHPYIVLSKDKTIKDFFLPVVQIDLVRTDLGEGRVISIVRSKSILPNEAHKFTYLGESKQKFSDIIRWICKYQFNYPEYRKKTLNCRKFYTELTEFCHVKMKDASHYVEREYYKVVKTSLQSRMGGVGKYYGTIKFR